MTLREKLTKVCPPYALAVGAWLLFTLSLALTVGIMYAVLYVLMAVWPDSWGR